MRLLLSSLEDRASINIRDRLLEMADWTEIGTFLGRSVYRRGDDAMVTIDRPHLFSDDIDASVSHDLGVQFERVLFLSRHKAASGIPTLTVHPIGNYGTADFGGRPGELVPSDPRLMTALLIQLTESAKGLPFQVSFETTHHGPWMKKPTSYIEIGSGEDNWGHEGAAKAIASAVLNADPLDDPIAIGVGGGHYAPRFSEVCLTKRISFGHMVPNYAIEKVDDAIALERMGKAAQASKAELVYIHRKSMSRSRATELKELACSLGLEAVESNDLEDRSG
jgi:D-aminoacyl-tRNA deacylase